MEKFGVCLPLPLFFLLLFSSSAAVEEQAIKCPQDGAGGVEWPSTEVGSTATISCHTFDFRMRGGNVTRYCDLLEVQAEWGIVDTRQCVFTAPVDSFLLLWVKVSSDSVDDINAAANLLKQEVADKFNVPTQAVMLRPAVRLVDPSTFSLTFMITFSETPDSAASMLLVGSIDSFLRPTNSSEIPAIGGFPISPEQNGYKGLKSTSSCSCIVDITSLFIGVCIGVDFDGPCYCIVADICTGCNTPFYVGDNVTCTVDSEADGYPDSALTLGCSPNLTNPQDNYCQEDVCPDIYNPTQDATSCQFNLPDFTGCRYGADPVWDIVWANTPAGQTDTQRCPASLNFATRVCGEGGWQAPDVSQCQSGLFTDYETTAEDIFGDSDTSLEDRLLQTSDITSDLLTLTKSEGDASILPKDLQSTNDIVAGVVGLLEETLDSSVTQVAEQNLLDIFNNVLNSSNVLGWTTLQNTGEAGSQLVLDSAERYGLYLADALNDSSPQRLRVWQRDNIVIGFSRGDPMSDTSTTFPESLEQIANASYTDVPARITIPASVLEQRMERGRSMSITNTIFRTMGAVLPRSDNSSGVVPTVVLSSQVGTRGSGVSFNDMTNLVEPVELEFTFDNVENASDYRCVYWNFSEPVGNGNWAQQGIKMMGRSVSGSKTTVRCRSSHLTSFAVLVIVSDDIIDDQLALEVVSYIGLALSSACLLVSIIFFLALGRELLTKVHYFIHFNLAISLLAGYLVFAIGIELGTRNMGGCVFVTVLLHYLFLAAFSWMLCEGVMLYLMLVVVFSKLSKRWWFFLLLGWGLPVIPVVVSVGARHAFYGVRDSEGELLYCWLSTSNGVIWAFVAPMVAIIMLNVFFLITALVKVYQTTRTKVQGNSDAKNVLKLFKALFKATIILLPILGLTWVLGIFAVNRNTLVFAWLFTIFNTMQGVLILVFHVLRSEKVWNSTRARRFKKHASSTFHHTSSSSFLKSSKQYTVSKEAGSHKAHHSLTSYKSGSELTSAESGVDPSNHSLSELVTNGVTHSDDVTPVVEDNA